MQLFIKKQLIRNELIISKEKIEDIMIVVKSLEKSGLLIQEVSETIKNEKQEQNGGFLSMLWETFAASILGNVSAWRGIIKSRWRHN